MSYNFNIIALYFIGVFSERKCVFMSIECKRLIICNDQKPVSSSSRTKPHVHLCYFRFHFWPL